MKDAEGTEIEVGDRILYAAFDGRSAVLHRGIVTGFKPWPNSWAENKEKVQVTIEGWQKKPKIVYLQYPQSIIVAEKGVKP